MANFLSKSACAINASLDPKAPLLVRDVYQLWLHSMTRRFVDFNLKSGEHLTAPQFVKQSALWLKVRTMPCSARLHL